jgi:hypothetical protein
LTAANTLLEQRLATLPPVVVGQREAVTRAQMTVKRNTIGVTIVDDPPHFRQNAISAPFLRESAPCAVVRRGTLSRQPFAAATGFRRRIDAMPAQQVEYSRRS